MLRQAIAASWHHIDTLLNPRGKSPVPFLPDKARNTLPFFDRLLVDASIRLPDAEPLEATRVASKEKHQHYAAQAASLHARVVPFIVETYGAWGDEAVEFAKQLRDHLVAAVKPVNPSEFYYHFCSEASVAVQRGNALVLESALQAARNSEQFAVRWPRSVVQVPGSLRIHVDAP